MKRKLLSKLLLSSLLIITVLGLVGCSNEKVATTIIEEETVSDNQLNEESNTISDNKVAEKSTVQTSKYGLSGITVEDFEKIFQTQDFFIYVATSYESNEDLTNSLKWAFEEKNVSILSESFIIDFSTLNEREQETLLTYFVPGTIYSVSSGVIDAFKEVPTADSETYEEDYNSLLQKWLYSKMIGVDYHGLDTITYEEILNKIEEKETFLVYIGRDSCKYCKIFTPIMTTILEESNLQTPIYYFFTQEYKNKINEEVSGAQEEWDAIKSRLGIEYTPSFIFYKNGEPTYYESFLEDDYLEASDKDKLVIEEHTKKQFKAFLLENGFSFSEQEQEENCIDCED